MPTVQVQTMFSLMQGQAWVLVDDAVTEFNDDMEVDPDPRERIDMSCLVCNENRRNILVLPCKHFILCNICYDSLQKKECIMCRQEITSCIEDIYI